MTTFNVLEKVTRHDAALGPDPVEFKKGNHTPEPGSDEEWVLIDLVHNGLATANGYEPLLGVEPVEEPAAEAVEEKPEAAPRQKKEA